MLNEGEDIMSQRYAIWDKVSDIITPSGKVYTADEWKSKYPAAKLDRITVICSGGEINGAIYDTLGAMKQRAEVSGATFETGLSDQGLLDAIESYENEQIAAVMNSTVPSAEERIAAALEYQNLLSL